MYTYILSVCVYLKRVSIYFTFTLEYYMYYNRQLKYIFKMINSHFSGEYNIEYVLSEIYLTILFYLQSNCIPGTILI